MAIDTRRRAVLLGLSAAGLLPLLGCDTKRAGDALLVSSFRDALGRHALCAFDSAGRILWQRLVPERAHDMVVHAATRRVAFVARRPGHHVWLLALNDGRLQRELRIPAASHFNGHAAFSADGTRLYTTETAYAPARGCIGIWDVASGKRIGELSSHGLDPHQCLDLGDTRTLVVANGGLLTAAGDERTKLNIDSMAPNLAYLDLHTGALKRRETLPQHQLSIRHLAKLPDGRIAAGLQYEGPADDDVSLVAMAGTTAGFDALPAPPQGWASFRQYVASVQVDASGRYLAASSPRGNCFGIWNAADYRALEQHALGDVAGIAPTRDGFVLTSGLGLLASWTHGRALRTLPAAHPGLAWDNHAESTGMLS